MEKQAPCQSVIVANSTTYGIAAGRRADNSRHARTKPVAMADAPPVPDPGVAADGIEE